MKLSTNFTLDELTSAPAKFNNVPSITEIGYLKALCENVLQPLRDHFGLPISIHSGFRNEAYNQSVGGATKSEHLFGYAADISVTGKTNEDIIDACQELKLPFYQIIDEQLYRKDGRLSKWIHISHRAGILNIQIVKTARNTKESLKAVYAVVT